MGSRAREILGMDVDKLIELLRRAYCDEWLAYHQYWLGAKLVKGPMKDAPPTKPSEWYTLTNCGYDAPDDPFVKTLLEQNIKGERCAINTYKELLDITKDKDPITYNTVLQILQQELEHEEDLQALLEDYELMMAAFRQG